MARQIVLHFQDTEVAFDFSAVDRARIYGRKRRVPLDRAQQPCTRASLLRDGSLILRAGMTAQGSFDDAGTWVPNGDLVGLDADGNALPRVESTLGVPVRVEAVTPQELLDHAIGTLYALTGDPPPELLRQLKAGAIFRFPFNYRPDWRSEVAFLVHSLGDDALYALIGKPTPPTWCALDTPPPPPVEESAEDDLDFEMFG